MMFNSNTLLASVVASLAFISGVSAAVPASRDIALASNPVDACNGSNHYGVGHSCAFSTPDGTSQGTCQDDSSGDLVCIPNPARRDIALADNPVDACNGSNNYGVGHSCAWKGGNEGTCQTNASGVLTCVN